MGDVVPRFTSVPKGRQKRRQVYQALREYIQHARVPAGSQMPTTHTLARQFGVSYVTMHTALDDLVREGWLVRHQGKGTFVSEGPKSSPRPKATHIAMVLPPQEDIRASGNSEIVLNFVQGCTLGCNAQGSDLAMVSLPSTPAVRDLEAAIQTLGRYDGAIFVGTQFAPLMAELKRLHYSYVLLAGGDPALGCEVNYDRPMAVRSAVRHLIEHGYRRIGFLGRMDSSPAAKFDDFRATLQEHSLELEPSVCEHCALIEEAQLAARRFLGNTAIPEAVFVDNYYKAEVLVRLAEYHQLRVPEDLAVMAYGTEHAGGIQPPLSLMEVPGMEMGREAALLLDRLIRGNAVPSTQRILQAHLVIRRSCGCAYQQKASAPAGARLQEVHV